MDKRELIRKTVYENPSVQIVTERQLGAEREPYINTVTAGPKKSWVKSFMEEVDAINSHEEAQEAVENIRSQMGYSS